MKNKIVSLLAVLFVFSLAATAKSSIDEGKALFTTRCTSCHNVNKQMVGPALANVDQRRNMEWIISFVNSPKSMIAKNDKDAIALFNQFNQVTMPDHSDLTADNIKNIVAYIKTQVSTATDKAPFATPYKVRPAYKPLTFGNYGFLISYLGLVVLLVGVLVSAVYVRELQRIRETKV
jgi:mono/diheme cytochrome c family protein